MVLRVLCRVFLFGLLPVLSACGNKGPLFLPESEMPATGLDAMPDSLNISDPDLSDAVQDTSDSDIDSDTDIDADSDAASDNEKLDERKDD